MQKSPSPQGQAPQSLMQRLDRLAGEMNSFLLVVAIGLAVLDLTCFVAFEATEVVLPAFNAQFAAQTTLQTAPVTNPIGQ